MVQRFLSEVSSVTLSEGRQPLDDTVHEMARDEARHGKAFEEVFREVRKQSEAISAHEQVCQSHHHVCDRLCRDAGSDLARVRDQGNGVPGQLVLYHRHGADHRWAGHPDSRRTAQEEPRKAEGLL